MSKSAHKPSHKASEPKSRPQQLPEVPAPQGDNLEHTLRALQEGAAAKPQDVLMLQRTIGNRRTQQIMQRAQPRKIQRYVTARELAQLPENDQVPSEEEQQISQEASGLPGLTRISENRNMVLLLEDDQPSGSQQLYATEGLIQTASGILETVGNEGSVVDLQAGDKRQFFGKELARVNAVAKARRGFNDMNDANNPEQSGTYNQQTENMIAPLNQTQEQVTEGNLQRPQTPQAAEAARIFTTAQINARLQETVGDSIELSEEEVTQITQQITARIQQIRALRGQGDDPRLALYKECIKASHAIMGVREQGSDVAVYTNHEGEQKTTESVERGAGGLKEVTTALFEIVKAELGEEFFDLLQKPESELDGEEKRKLIEKEREMGFNRGVNPEIGEAYATVSNEWMEDFEKYQDAEGTWNQHWATVVMKDETDNITLENAADNPINIDRGWWFQMFGTVKDGQTFHEQALASKWFGNMATTLRMRAQQDAQPQGQGTNLKTFNVSSVDRMVRERQWDDTKKDNHQYLAGNWAAPFVEELLMDGLKYAFEHLRQDKKGRGSRVQNWRNALTNFIQTKGGPIDHNEDLTGEHYNVRLAQYVLDVMGGVRT